MLPPLPFRISATSCSLEALIFACDRDDFYLPTQTSFQMYIPAIKEVTNARSISSAPFLKKWEHPGTQLCILSRIISSTPMLVNFPKPQTLTKTSPLLIGEFKADFWRCIEFVNVLADLYEYNQAGVNNMLKDPMEKSGPALLLLVLAQGGSPSNFSAHLLQM